MVFIAIFIDVPFLFGFPLVFSYLTLKLIIDKRRLNFLIQIINIHFNLGFNQKKENGSGLYLLRKKENGKNELNLSFLRAKHLTIFTLIIFFDLLSFLSNFQLLDFVNKGEYFVVSIFILIVNPFTIIYTTEWLFKESDLIKFDNDNFKNWESLLGDFFGIFIGNLNSKYPYAILILSCMTLFDSSNIFQPLSSLLSSNLGNVDYFILYYTLIFKISIITIILILLFGIPFSYVFVVLFDKYFIKNYVSKFNEIIKNDIGIKDI